MLSKFKSNLDSILIKKNADFIIFFSFDEFFLEMPPKSRQYLQNLTGFCSSNAVFIYSRFESFYYTDGRYLPEAKLFFAAQGIQVLDIKSNNYLDKVLHKKTLFFKQNLKLHFYLKYKESINFIFLTKEEFLNIFKQNSQIDEIADLQNFKISYPKGFLAQRMHDFLQQVKQFFAEKEISTVNCIFLHNIQFTSWLTGKRCNLAAGCAAESILFLLINDNFELENLIEIEGNNSNKIIEIATLLEDKNIFCDDEISIFYQELLSEFSNNFICHKFNTNEIQSIKSEYEIKKIQKAHLAHAKAFNLFTKWIKRQDFDVNRITEYELAEQLEIFCKQDKNFIGLSFDSIIGCDENSASIHYKPNTQSAKQVTSESIILIDCGWQYKFGTTDMTRMIFLKPKNLTTEFKTCYTAVVKAHIQLALTVFTEGTKGSCLDFVARREILKIHKNYNHGTGHGVGFCLNVHEHPSISPLSENIIKEGQVVSIEPGIYIENKFGIRIENLYYVEKIKNKNFQNKSFLKFTNLTTVKIDTSAILKKYLSVEEIDWLKKHNKNK